MSTLIQNAWRIGFGLAMGLISFSTLACSSDDSSSPIVPLNQLPLLTNFSIEPTTVTASGQTLTFTLSGQVSTPEGLRADDPFLIRITPPLGNPITLPPLDASDIPSCFGGASACTWNAVGINADPVIVDRSGSYLVTLSVLDQQNQLAQVNLTINAIL